MIPLGISRSGLLTTFGYVIIQPDRLLSSFSLQFFGRLRIVAGRKFSQGNMRAEAIVFQKVSRPWASFTATATEAEVYVAIYGPENEGESYVNSVNKDPDNWNQNGTWDSYLV
jgi:hypothetical protein